MWEPTTYKLGPVTELTKVKSIIFRYRGRKEISKIKATCGCSVPVLLVEKQDDFWLASIDVTFNVPERELHFDLDEDQSFSKSIFVTYVLQEGQDKPEVEVLSLTGIIKPDMSLIKYQPDGV